MSIAQLSSGQAAAAARLHIAGQPGTFLTSLGLEVLTVLYEVLPLSGVGFGFAAFVGPSEPLGPLSAQNNPASPGGEMVGFVSATTSSARLFFELGTRHLGRFLPSLLRRYARQPYLAWRSAETVLYPLLAGGQGAHPSQQTAELLSIMVEPARRGQGVGSLLLHALCTECLARGITHLEVTVAAANHGAQRFYTRHGFQAVRSFSLYGRPMCGYTLEIERLPQAQEQHDPAA